jgi:integrase
MTSWIDQRPNLRPRTTDLYRWLYGRYIGPMLGRRRLVDLTPGTVRAWRAELLAGGASATMAAKAYRLLRAALNTAVEDELIRRNPCRIKGAGQERPAERPVATVAQVYALADAVPPRFRLLVVMAAFTSLRYGELAALRRADVNTQTGAVIVRATLVERQDGSLLFGPPKTEAGRRTVTMPAAIRQELREHLRTFVGADDDALVFTGVTGAPLRRSNFQRASRWTEAVCGGGPAGLPFPRPAAHGQ